MFTVGQMRLGVTGSLIRVGDGSASRGEDINKGSFDKLRAGSATSHLRCFAQDDKSFK